VSANKRLNGLISGGIAPLLVSIITNACAPAASRAKAHQTGSRRTALVQRRHYQD
jgi:hypothetical protein